MQYPTLTELENTVEITNAFGGYNHNLRISPGEFYDMQNLTSSSYPVLSPRGQRGVYASTTNPQGLIANDKLCYVDGTNFVVGDQSVSLGLSTDPYKCPKTLVSMGVYVIIFPDKKYVNVSYPSDYGSMEASFQNGTHPITLSICDREGKGYDITYTRPTEPEGPADGDIWLDNNKKPYSLKQYSASSGMWVSIATTYIKISSPNIGMQFKQYDGVTISGFDKTAFHVPDSEETFSDEEYRKLDGSFVIWDRGDDFIVITGFLSEPRAIDDTITVKREVPDMDFVIESENRLWGCRYGQDPESSFTMINEIYASKLGDFRNWNCFMGVSTDSYAASIGTDGPFTGAVSYLGYPIFFKEKYMHKIYGNYPSNYQIQTSDIRGVQKGSGSSLAIVNEVLYYKSQNGICAYDGSLPVEISSPLGDVFYDSATACAHRNKYYISMRDPKADAHSPYRLFVYDTVRGMWHKEDNTYAKAFCSYGNELYYIETTPYGSKIKTMFGSGTKDTEPVEWMAQTGIIGVENPMKKYISKLIVRMSLAMGTKICFHIQYDSADTWEHICTLTGTSLRSFSIPIRPRRCDHLRLRIIGQGDAKIYSIAKVTEQGSDV